MEKITRTSLADLAHKRLHHAIITGEMPEGSPLREERLAVSLGLSRTPVREAILRLVAEELAETRPGYTTVVRSISREDALDLLEAYSTLFTRAVELAVPKLTEDDLAAMERCVDALAKLPADDVDGAYTLTTEQNDILYAASGSREIHRLIRLLRPRIEMLTRIRHPEGGVGPSATKRQRAQLKAMRARDTAKLLDLFNQGLVTFRRSLENWNGDVPALGDDEDDDEAEPSRPAASSRRR